MEEEAILRTGAIYLNYNDMFAQSFKCVTMHLPTHLMTEMLCLVATSYYMSLFMASTSMVLILSTLTGLHNATCY